MPKIVIIGFYFAVFFPYISIVDVMGSDVQINAFLVSLPIALYYFNKKRDLIIELRIFYVLAYISILIMLLMFPVTISSIREVFTYVSLPIITMATYYVIESEKGLNEKYIKIIIHIWLICGIIQTVTNPFIFEFLLNSTRTSIGRGVTSLAPEPTYYGTIMLLLILLAFKFKTKSTYYVGICLFQILFLAKSSMISLFVLLGVLFYFMNKGSARSILFYLLSAISLIYVVVSLMKNFAPDLRMTQNIIEIVNNPIQFIQEDESVNLRVGHIVYSIKGSIENYLIPLGYNETFDYFSAQNNKFFSSVVGVDTIMRGSGRLLFQLGIFGLLGIVTMQRSVSSFYQEKKTKFLFSTYWLLLLCTALPLSTPTLSFIIGYGVFYKYRKC